MSGDRQRPDPDRLLEEITRREEHVKEGRFKVFLGAAPGVGKTYAMLEAARDLRKNGVDVVVGVAECHGRKETEALLVGLEALPRRRVSHRGHTIEELDLEASLARHPTVLLVDELAHDNAPGSRHRKRWQDVFEILAAGIDVYATLNVQHLESLSDVVTQITGVIVRETLPDSVLDRADVIELVDLPPEDLLRRLREGKVYLQGLAESARRNFFRPGNLSALRELALRRTADRVDQQMLDYRREKGVDRVWPATERILVCVGANPRSIRLIRAARRMAAGLRAQWVAVHVEAPSRVRPSPDDLGRLEEHLRLAESLGGETVVISGHRAEDEILDYARRKNVTKIIVGKPTHPRWKDRLFGSMMDRLVRDSGDIDVYVISGDSAEPLRPPPEPRPVRWDWRDCCWTIGPVVLATLVSNLMKSNFNLADLVMVYLLAVVITASRARAVPTFLTSILSVAAVDFFFVPPYYTFAVDDFRHVVTFSVLLLVAVVISRLTLKVREQATAARLREMRTAALFGLSRELVNDRNLVKIGATVVRSIKELLGGRATVLTPDDEGVLRSLTSDESTLALDAQEMGVAQWVFQNKLQAGVGTDTLPGAKGLHLPLLAQSAIVGVMGVVPGASDRRFTSDQKHLLDGFANLTAMALERIFLAREAQRAKVRAETESLRNTLLSSVSHDLRTPLAAIAGSASTLLQPVSLNAGEMRELAETIVAESDRLNRLIGNILDMTRLESGGSRPEREWQSIEEVVGATLERFHHQLSRYPLTTDIPRDLPLVFLDPQLIGQVLANLLENAFRHTPEGTPLELSAGVDGDRLVVSLADRGPGIPEGDEDRIFEKFHRGSAKDGAGLGLAICRAILAVHGGEIEARNRPGGGAVFRFSLPLGGETPPIDADSPMGR